MMTMPWYLRTIRPIRAVPGGSLLNPVYRPVPQHLMGRGHARAMPGGVASRVSRSAVLRMTRAPRASGHAGSRVHVQQAARSSFFRRGSASRLPMSGALLASDPRNPMVAHVTARAAMPVGATVYR